MPHERAHARPSGSRCAARSTRSIPRRRPSSSSSRRAAPPRPDLGDGLEHGTLLTHAESIELFKASRSAHDAGAQRVERASCRLRASRRTSSRKSSSTNTARPACRRATMFLQSFHRRDVELLDRARARIRQASHAARQRRVSPRAGAIAELQGGRNQHLGAALPGVLDLDDERPHRAFARGSRARAAAARHHHLDARALRRPVGAQTRRFLLPHDRRRGDAREATCCASSTCSRATSACAASSPTGRRRSASMRGAPVCRDWLRSRRVRCTITYRRRRGAHARGAVRSGCARRRRVRFSAAALARSRRASRRDRSRSRSSRCRIPPSGPTTIALARRRHRGSRRATATASAA